MYLKRVGQMWRKIREQPFAVAVAGIIHTKARSAREPLFIDRACVLSAGGEPPAAGSPL